MNVFDRVRAAWRAFVAGPAVVTPADIAWGKAGDEFQPAEYGDYIATSNGVYTCARLRSQALSSLPLVLYKRAADGLEVVKEGRTVDLLRTVNPFWSFSRLLEMTELSLCLWGEAFWVLERGKSRRQPPKEIWWVRPDRMRVVPHQTDYVSHFVYTSVVGAQDIRFERDEVIWFRYPNPLDEYEGLSPLAAARLAADVASAAMKSNYNLFRNGIQIGGVIMPKQGAVLTEEQARLLEQDVERRFKGVDKAHRWGIFRFEADVRPLGINPKDAEFLGALRWSLEDICRAYNVPLDLVGGQRTYENVNAAEKAFWLHCIKPEASFIAAEITEFLLPLLGEADVAEFDFSGIDVLHESEAEAWTRAKEQIQVGAITINEWRGSIGLGPVPWGDAWWAPLAVAPISGAAQQKEREAERGCVTRDIAFGSPEHEIAWRKFLLRTEPHQKRFAAVMADLFQRQQSSVLARLRHRERSAEEAASEPFDMAQWIKSFREAARPIMLEIIHDSASQALLDLGVGISFDVNDPLVIRFLEASAQRFARYVNETTWQMLKDSLAEGIANGESIEQLSERVLNVMAERIRSAPETIARTEVLRAANGGLLEAWRQSGVVEAKRWLAAIDERTRPTHVAAHGQVVPLGSNFMVGAGAGPAPGQIGIAEEDVNCRCTMVAVLRSM